MEQRAKRDALHFDNEGKPNISQGQNLDERMMKCFSSNEVSDSSPIHSPKLGSK